MHMEFYRTLDSLSIIHWWVDAVYGVHWDCKGHIGAMVSMGNRAIFSFSRGQKLNARSSTRAELIVITDALGIILWTKYFMEAQGYTIDTNIIFQDNKSTILQATNGRQSAEKKSKHIKNKFFLVADKVV